MHDSSRNLVLVNIGVRSCVNGGRALHAPPTPIGWYYLSITLQSSRPQWCFMVYVTLNGSSFCFISSYLIFFCDQWSRPLLVIWETSEFRSPDARLSDPRGFIRDGTFNYPSVKTSSGTTQGFSCVTSTCGNEITGLYIDSCQGHSLEGNVIGVRRVWRLDKIKINKYNMCFYLI